MQIKDHIQIRVRLRQAQKTDLVKNKNLVMGTPYYVLQKDNTVKGPYITNAYTDKTELNFQFKMHWIYVEETPQNNNNLIELYK